MLFVRLGWDLGVLEFVVVVWGVFLASWDILWGLGFFVLVLLFYLKHVSLIIDNPYATVLIAGVIQALYLSAGDTSHVSMGAGSVVRNESEALSFLIHFVLQHCHGFYSDL